MQRRAPVMEKEFAGADVAAKTKKLCTQYLLQEKDGAIGFRFNCWPFRPYCYESICSPIMTLPHI
jgi:hypothetical protein